MMFRMDDFQRLQRIHVLDTWYAFREIPTPEIVRSHTQ